MNKPIWHLEKSAELLDRKEFVAHLKTYISVVDKNIQDLEKMVSEEKELLKKLKIKLSEYDVYQQKIITKCPTCNEADCVCYVLDKPKEPETEKKKLTPDLPF